MLPSKRQASWFLNGKEETVRSAGSKAGIDGDSRRAVPWKFKNEASVVGRYAWTQKKIEET